MKNTLMNRQSGIVAFFLLSLLGFSRASKIGINYGRIGDNLPSPIQSIELIKSMNADSVKLYDANPEILTLLENTNLGVSIMLPNDHISIVASNQSNADTWIAQNVLPYYPKTLIRYLLVGNEVLSYSSAAADRRNWLDLVPAMNNLQSSLETLAISDIKIGTPLAMDALRSTFPPSAGEFRSDVAHSVISPLLQFLKITNSFFFIDVYPYFSWSENPSFIGIDSALLNPENPNPIADPATGLVYWNLLDQMIDAVVFAMAKLGFLDVPVFIAETGWPTASGGAGASVENAAVYNRNLVRKMAAEPPVGTPARPGLDIPTFIFSLFDEDLKSGPGVERHWGLLRADGTAAYEFDLTGKRRW